MKHKRTRLEKREKIQQTLEGYRRFDYDYIPFGHNWTVPDETYPYRPRGLHKIPAGVIRGLLWLLAPVLIKVAYGARVTGRENLKELNGKGALCVCNHFAYLDTLFVRQAVGQFRSYHTMTQYNNKKGIAGWFMRHGGMLPFSSSFGATRNLNRELEKLFAEGKIVNIYAEQAMWVNYQKPRPMKDGVFHYALKYGVPVLPIFCTFRKNARGHMRKLRIHILPPVYADDTLGRTERAADMKARAEAAWKNCYETAYKKPLEYLPDRRKNRT